jgi:hypothetical protein
MQRSTREVKPEPPADFSPLIRACMYLDECLKRGVVVGVYEDSLEVSDEDIRKALANVQAQIANVREDMERLARTITRVTQVPGSRALQ